MSSDPSSPLSDPRARLAARIAAGALILGVGFVVAPFVYTAITGVAGLIAAGALIGTTVMLLPWAQTKAANLRLKLVKMEVAANPVESLQVEHARQTEDLNSRKVGLETLSGAIRVVAETIRKLEAEFPDSSELEQLRQDHADLRDHEAAVKAEWQACYVTLGEFAQEIRRAGRLWEAALAIAKARGLSSLSKAEWEGKMKTETALDSIRLKLNTGLAGLSTDRMQANADRILKGQLAAKAAPKASMVNSDVVPAQRTATRQTIS